MWNIGEATHRLDRVWRKEEETYQRRKRKSETYKEKQKDSEVAHTYVMVQTVGVVVESLVENNRVLRRKPYPGRVIDAIA